MKKSETIVGRVMDGKWFQLKEELEGLIANKITDKIKQKKQEIVDKINNVKKEN